MSRLNWLCKGAGAPGWINAGRKEAPGVDLACDIVVDGLPLDGESVDGISCQDSLHRFPLYELPAILLELHRVLKPGGRLVVTNMTPGMRVHERIWDALYARGIDVFINCRGVLAAPALGHVGFEDVRREYMAPLLFPTEIVTARRAPLL